MSLLRSSGRRLGSNPNHRHLRPPGSPLLCSRDGHLKPRPAEPRLARPAGPRGRRTSRPALTTLHGARVTRGLPCSALVAGASATVASALPSDTREARSQLQPIARVRAQDLIQLSADHNPTPRRTAAAGACFASGCECVDGRHRRCSGRKGAFGSGSPAPGRCGSGACGSARRGRACLWGSPSRSSAMVNLLVTVTGGLVEVGCARGEHGGRRLAMRAASKPVVELDGYLGVLGPRHCWGDG
jgi:hypothetical protein